MMARVVAEDGASVDTAHERDPPLDEGEHPLLRVARRAPSKSTSDRTRQNWSRSLSIRSVMNGASGSTVAPAAAKTRAALPTAASHLRVDGQAAAGVELEGRRAGP